ncbi:MAG: iron-sulfur cluster assembly scaffold protein [Desulfobacterales bacterium]|nr:iron-sulfur cluster assembly scaffold protein [Desulfobacterales bacterium]
MGEDRFYYDQGYSLDFLEMAFRTDRRKLIKNPDGYGKGTSDCGDAVGIFLKLKGDRIESVTYEVDGCMNTNACANAMAELSEGKTIDEAREITSGHIIGYLKTLPPENAHCAELAIEAFHLALSNIERNKKTNQ